MSNTILIHHPGITKSKKGITLFINTEETYEQFLKDASYIEAYSLDDCTVVDVTEYALNLTGEIVVNKEMSIHQRVHRPKTLILCFPRSDAHAAKIGFKTSEDGNSIFTIKVRETYEEYTNHSLLVDSELFNTFSYVDITDMDIDTSHLNCIGAW